MKSLVENKIIISGSEITYVYVAKRNKNIYFRFKEDGILYISGPKSAEKNIEKLINQNQESILKLKQKIESKKDKPLTYLGNPINLIITDTKPALYDDVIYAKSKEDALNYLYKKSLSYFEKRVNVLKQDFNNLPNFKVKSRLMKTKWGVCNTGSMTVTLNQTLITKKPDLIDYVIVHELSHFKHMNHSAAFWEEVAKHYPNYKNARKELNQWSSNL